MTIEFVIRIRFIERMPLERVKGLVSALFLKSITIGDWVIVSANEIAENSIRK